MFNFECATHMMDDYDQGLLNKLKRLRQETNWDVKRERHRLSRKLYPLIENWVKKLPDLRDIFQQEEIEWLLIEDVKKLVINGGNNSSFLEFVFRTGYKDVPGLDEDGKPLLRRTTPVHYAARRMYHLNVINKLFEIYDSDANYTDESGFSHLHAACMTKQCRVVEAFIQHGQDPNLVWPETDDTPLLLALRSQGGDYDLAETLLRLGANPNLANAEGLTPLHVIIRGRVKRNEWLRLLFELSHDKYHPLQIDAQDEFGRTPLHTAVFYGHRDIAELLLIHGADPNLPDEDGSTPLHVLCKIDYQRTVDPMMECFFKVCNETQKTVRVDYLDNQGRTPLQLAVANLLPKTIDILLDRGADLTSFVFPTERQFGAKLKMPKYYSGFQNALTRASGAMIVAERLEKRGYELKRSDALIIMNYFARCELMEKSADFIKYLRSDHTFWSETSRIMILPRQSDGSYPSRHYDPRIYVNSYNDRNVYIPGSEFWPPMYFPDNNQLSNDNFRHYYYPPDRRMVPNFFQPPVPDNDRQRTKLSLHDLISLQPKEMMNRLTYSNFFELVQKPAHMRISDEQNKALSVHLCEKLSRGFFRRWGLDSLMELTRLPLICCDIIIEQLINEDLYHICCATAGQSSLVQ